MEGTRKKEEKAKVCEKNGEEDVRREVEGMQEEGSDAELG